MTTETQYPQPTQSPERELLATFAEWARQVAAREDVPRGIRSAAAGLHDDGKRMLASDPLSRFGFEAVINPNIPAGVVRLYQDGKLVGEIQNIKASS